MANCWWKAWANRFKNLNFFDFLTCYFCSLERRFFVVEYRKDIFLAYSALKKDGKWPIFDQNYWLINPFGEIVLENKNLNRKQYFVNFL